MYILGIYEGYTPKILHMVYGVRCVRKAVDISDGAPPYNFRAINFEFRHFATFLQIIPEHSKISSIGKVH